MYFRPQPYSYQSEVRLPQNYSGNTFREPIEINEPDDADNIEQLPEDDTPTEEQSPRQNEAQTASLLPKPNFKLRLGSLFGNGKGGIGTEEILILALILLLGDSEENDDLILFLMLLLFIK